MAVVSVGITKSKSKNTSKVSPNGGDAPIDTSPHGNASGVPASGKAATLAGDRANHTNKIRGFATATSAASSARGGGALGTRGATKVAIDAIVNDPFPIDHEQRRLSVMGMGLTGGNRSKYEEERRMASVGGGGE